MGFSFTKTGPKRTESLGVILIVCLSLLYSPVGEILSSDEPNSASSTSKEPPSLTVMTWNIGGADLKASPALNEHILHIASVIKEADPHLIALQEQAGQTQLKKLLTQLDGRYKGKTLARNGGRGVSLLYRIPIKEVKKIKTPIGWSMLSATTISHPLDISIRIVSCYAPSGRQSSKRKTICQSLVDYARRVGPVTLLAGDFNFSNENIAERIPFLTDSIKRDRSTYQILTRHGIDCGKGAGSTALLGRRVDYIFFFPKQTEFAITDARVLRNKRIPPMDHNPLCVTISLANIH